MNDSPPPRRSPWRRLLLILVAFLAVLALGAFIAGQIARQQWDATKAAMLADGRLGTWRSLLGPAVAEAENFAAIPALRPHWEYIAAERPPSGAGEVRVPPDLLPELQAKGSLPDFQRPAAPDLRAIAASLQLEPGPPEETPAAAILRALAPSAPLLEALAEGARRSNCRFPVRYEKGFDATLPSYVTFRRFSQQLALRALARIELGQAPAAAQDIVTILRVGQHLRREGPLLSELMGTSVSRHAVLPIWHGCASHAWGAAELALLDDALRPTDLLADLRRGLRFEQAVSIEMTEDLLQRGRRQTFQTLRALGQGTLLALGGDAIVYPALVELARVCTGFIESLPASRGERFDPEPMLRAHRAFEERPARWSGILVAMAVPSYLRAVYRVASTQARLELCLAALCLEKARLAQGTYPSSAAGLGLPNDLMSGQPLTYEPAPDGQSFLLRGRGWKLEEMPASKDDPWSWPSAR